MRDTTTANREAKYREQEENRGVPDADLDGLSETRLLLLGLARLMESIGCDDEALIEALYRRGQKRRRRCS